MGLFGRKKDFWDEVDVASEDPGYQALSENMENDILPDEEPVIENGNSLLTNLPLKIFARILMFLAAVVMCVSGIVIYTYFNNGGSMTSEPDYYHSNFFGEEYNRNMIQLIHLIQAIENRGEISDTNADDANQELIRNYMGENGNLSYAVYDERDYEVVTSGEDAVARIEASYYFIKIDTSEGMFSVNTGIKNPAYDEATWREEMAACSNGYTLYAAVDNEFSSVNDGFYASYEEFNELNDLFNAVKIVFPIAGVIFVLLFIFSIIATGNVKGYQGIKLTWFDKIFTEIAALLVILLGGGSAYGAWYVYNSDLSMRMILIPALLVLTYIIIIQGYFSCMRRIKAGTFINNMLFYKMFELIDKLPGVSKVLVIILVLLLINGALVLALFKLDYFEVMGIPIVYVIVPIIFVLENICFVSWVIRKGNAEYDDDETADEEEEIPLAAEESEEELLAADLGGDTQPALDTENIAQEVSANDWEDINLGEAVDKAINEEDSSMADGEESAVPVGGETVMLPKDEMEGFISTASVVRDSATSFDFIQLNKDIRKLHRSVLKENGVAVTLRAPDKPIVLEMNKEDMWKAISIIYDNLEQYAEPDSRVYAEMYTQDGKLIYVVKNAVKAEAIEAAQAIASGTSYSGGLQIAKEIIEKNHGKFVVALDGNIFKTGILLNITQE